MSNIYIQEPPTNGKVLLHTSAGELEIELWSKEAPLASRNFVQLCLESYYKGTVFHRVIPGFIAQGGDPTGTGDGGDSIYGKPFKDEFHSRLRFVRRGLVAMANSGSHDNGSQFFFTLGVCKELHNKHTIFGKVTGDTLYNLPRFEEGEIGKDERPMYPHRINGAEVLLNPFDDIVPRVAITNEVDKASKKASKKGVKNFSLLSFGGEAEEEEEGDISATQALAQPALDAKERIREKLRSLTTQTKASAKDDLTEASVSSAQTSKHKKHKDDKEHRHQDRESRHKHKDSRQKDKESRQKNKDSRHKTTTNIEDYSRSKDCIPKDKDLKRKVAPGSGETDSAESDMEVSVGAIINEVSDADGSDSTRAPPNKKTKKNQDDGASNLKESHKRENKYEKSKSSRSKRRDSSHKENSGEEMSVLPTAAVTTPAPTTNTTVDIKSGCVTNVNKVSTTVIPATVNSSSRAKRKFGDKPEDSIAERVPTSVVLPTLPLCAPPLPPLPAAACPKQTATDEADAVKAKEAAERREEIRQLKRELSGRDKKTKKQDKPEEKVSEEQLEDTKDTTKVSAVKEYWIEKQKYVEQHKTLPPKKSTKRQDLSLAMFDKFTKRVKSALYDGESKEEGESWFTQNLLFDSDAPVLAKDASSKDDSWYPLDDPRNPLNRARRGDTDKQNKKDKRHAK